MYKIFNLTNGLDYKYNFLKLKLGCVVARTNEAKLLKIPMEAPAGGVE